MTKTELIARIQRQDNYGPVRAIKFADGEHISVQAGQSLYCSLRKDDAPWTKVECGFPSFHPSPELMEYCEDPENPTETVYCYVPIEVVLEEIEAHGGPHSDDSRG